jgi:16S rRNA (cytidine1402-2'-O)-methyltransferase
MPLTLVATPIGNYHDITIRGRTLIENADVLIGEEHRATSTLLKKINLPQREIFLLNEHSKPKDIEELVDLCRTQNVVLVSDCGTPVFCDPGSHLVKKLREQNIPVTSAPGPSSLMTLLSLSSKPIMDFYFVGFLPAETEERKKRLQELNKTKMPLVIMETPYRAKKCAEDIAQNFRGRFVLLGLNLTAPNEFIIEAPASHLPEKMPEGSHEFIALIY